MGTMKVLALFAMLAIGVPTLSAQVQFTLTGSDRIVVTIDSRYYTTFYLAVNGQKPYIWPLSTADGLVVTRHFPMEQFPGETNDHPHHKGLFFSHGDINGVDFWDTEPRKSPEAPKRASMKLVRVEEMRGGEKSGTIKVVFDGLDPAGNAVMRETRTVVFHNGASLRIIDYGVTIEPLASELELGDTKEGTFGIRLATSMTEDAGKGGRMVNAEGAETEKNVWGKRSEWIDYSGPVDGKVAGVAIFDTPSNPRYPTYWHSRAYGLEAANPFGLHDFLKNNLHDGDMVVERGHPVHFQYRVVIHDGDTKSADIAGLYKAYLAEKH